MRPPLRRSKLLLVGLICVCFIASFFFIAVVPPDFSQPLQHKQVIGDRSVIRYSSTEKLNSIKQEIGRGLRVPAGIILEDRNYSEPLNSIVNGSIGGFRDDAEIGEIEVHNVVNAADGEKQVQSIIRSAVGKLNRLSQQHSLVHEKLCEMEDQLIMAKTYLQFAPPNSRSHLVKELKLRIREIERLHGHTRGLNLSRSALQRMRAMEDTLSKAHKAYPDCSAMASKLRAMTQNTEDQLRAQKNQASYLIQLAASTFPKGLHCLSMRLTTEYFTLMSEDRELPNRDKARQEDLFHYAIFSDNVLACAVVVNSTISTSQEPEKLVFHVVTDSLNFPAMNMWFLMNPTGQATIQIQNMDEFNWLHPDFSSSIKQSGVRDPRFISPLNYLRFYLPDIFPYLNKILLLDHDVVVQKDLRGLWKIDMKGKVIGVVETCEEDDSLHRLDMLVDFSKPTIAQKFDPKACLWAFGMNMLDLHEWRKRGLTHVYNKWFELGKTMQSWKAGSLPLGQLTFYNHSLALDRQWHVLGLGQEYSSVDTMTIERAALIHYNGHMKPWLEIGIAKFKGFWNKFLNYEQPFLQQCNIHE